MRERLSNQGEGEASAGEVQQSVGEKERVSGRNSQVSSGLGVRERSISPDWASESPRKKTEE